MKQNLYISIGGLSILKLILSLVFLSYSAFSEEKMSEAMKLMQVSCDKKAEPKACYNLANMYANRNMAKESDQYFARACKLDYELACSKTRWKKSEEKKAQKKEDFKFLTGKCKQLIEAIAECKEFECSQANLLSKDLQIFHKVTGRGLDNFCKYIYNISEDRIMVCFMDKRVSKRFRGLTESEALNQLYKLEKNGICNEKDKV